MGLHRRHVISHISSKCCPIHAYLSWSSKLACNWVSLPSLDIKSISIGLKLYQQDLGDVIMLMWGFAGMQEVIADYIRSEYALRHSREAGDLHLDGDHPPALSSMASTRAEHVVFGAAGCIAWPALLFTASHWLSNQLLWRSGHHRHDAEHDMMLLSRNSPAAASSQVPMQAPSWRCDLTAECESGVSCKSWYLDQGATGQTMHWQSTFCSKRLA